MQEDLDPNLQSLFQQEESRLGEKPFLDTTLARIERMRFRSALNRKLLLVLGLVACALVSPHLIAASAFLSGQLAAAFDACGGFLDKPAGLPAALAAGALLLCLFRRRVFAALAALF